MASKTPAFLLAATLLGFLAACAVEAPKQSATYVPRVTVNPPTVTTTITTDPNAIVEAKVAAGLPITPNNAPTLCVQSHPDNSITLETCTGEGNQQWTLTGGAIDQNGLCISPTDPNNQVSTPTRLVPCAGQKDYTQLWQLENAYINRASFDSGVLTCLSVADNASPVAGIAVAVAACDANNVTWSVGTGGAAMHLTTNPNTCLQVGAGSGTTTTNGDLTVHAAPCSDVQAQLWQLVGSEMHASGLGPLCLTYADPNTSNNAVTVAACNEASTDNTQRWLISQWGNWRSLATSGACLQPDAMNNIIVTTCVGQEGDWDFGGD